jgi:hypothetical protein
MDQEEEYDFEYDKGDEEELTRLQREEDEDFQNMKEMYNLHDPENVKPDIKQPIAIEFALFLKCLFLADTEESCLNVPCIQRLCDKYNYTGSAIRIKNKISLLNQMDSGKKKPLSKEIFFPVIKLCERHNALDAKKIAQELLNK